jgi:hypothetical protein
MSGETIFINIDNRLVCVMEIFYSSLKCLLCLFVCMPILLGVQLDQVVDGGG